MQAGPGTVIDDLQVTTDSGDRVRLSSFVDAFLVVFFYPKAFTGGCTNQACRFRDLGPDFDALGVARVGVSRDLTYPGPHQRAAVCSALPGPRTRPGQNRMGHGVGTSGFQLGRSAS